VNGEYHTWHIERKKQGLRYGSDRDQHCGQVGYNACRDKLEDELSQQDVE
jgi:hypothetical protein